MKADIQKLICDPATKEPLEAVRDEYYFNPKSGRRYPIENNIPILLTEGDLTGDNRTYERMYHWIAFAYDFMELAIAPIFIKDSLIKMRRELMEKLEIKAGNKVLIVSIGTGMDLRFLPETAEYYGLDITKSMLRKCQSNNKKWRYDLSLFNGNAEKLPFQDESFDVVFHNGGINFFNDKALAIREMIRVAKPGTKILIGDETEKLVKDLYDKYPLSERNYKTRKEAVTVPVDLIPPGMEDLEYDPSLWGGKYYRLTFRKPSRPKTAPQ
jgi:ubiquinone/menaquinone biosynthesis C-methylase UbiE